MLTVKSSLDKAYGKSLSRPRVSSRFNTGEALSGVIDVSD